MRRLGIALILAAALFLAGFSAGRAATSRTALEPVIGWRPVVVAPAPSEAPSAGLAQPGEHPPKREVTGAEPVPGGESLDGGSPAPVVAGEPQPTTGVPSPAVSPEPVHRPTIAVARAWALSVLGATQYRCLDVLVQRESRWVVTARNPVSGAYGLPQAYPGSKMASAGADWRWNPVTQLRWMRGYIAARYGTACRALAHSIAHGWY